MEKSQKNKILVISIVIIMFIISFFAYKNFFWAEQEIDASNEVVNENNENSINNLIDKWEYIEAINTYEKKWTWSLERDEKMKLVYAYLNYWNYFYKEEENSKKALDILNTIDEDYEVLYYKWYANEIVKDYSEALEYYFKWLDTKDLTDENKSQLMNQVWHLYDVKWEFDKVFEYYDWAYKLDNNNENVLWNLWRYYARVNEFEKSNEFLNKALTLTNNLSLKSELSFALSSIELELNWLNPDIDKSIDFAKKSIEYYPNYAMGYTALARGLYMKNDSKYSNEIEKNLEKSINLNPDWHYAYYLYWLLEFDRANFQKASEYFKKTIAAIDKDMILMESEREAKMNWLLFDSIMIGTLKNNPKDQNLLMRLIEKTGWLQNWKIIFQIKRENYWIFSPLKDNKEFQKLIENYKK